MATMRGARRRSPGPIRPPVLSGLWGLGLCLLASLVLPGCGAGLITGAAASGGANSGANPPPLRTPNANIDDDVLPLVPNPGTERRIILTDVELPVGVLPEVILKALGEAVSQTNVVVSDQGDSVVVAFSVTTEAIRVATGNPTAADVEATIEVVRDGRPVAEPVNVTLARQPIASLKLDIGESAAFVSPNGQALTVEVEGLRSTQPDDVQVLISTLDPTGPIGARLVRSASGVVVVPGVEGKSDVTAVLPGNTFSTPIEIVVRDVRAGESTRISNVFYRPDVTLALPSQGPTTGDVPVTLIGSALAPLDFTTKPAQIDFDRVRLTLQKEGRTIELPPEDLLTVNSDLDRLEFTMPPSPDGRPGQVDIVLRVQLPGAEAVVVASQVFLFANPDPFYGPRGAVLDQMPVASVPIALDNAPSTVEAPDFAMLTEQGGVGFVQLLLAQQNGMFQPFRAPRQVGDHEVLAERNPRDLLTGDFDGDSVPDLFIVNQGTGGVAAHHVVLGQVRPAPPLGDAFVVADSGGYTRGRVADFDRDGIVDVLLVPGPNAPPASRPHVLLSRPVAPGQPSFSAPIGIDVREFPYEAFEVGDFDNDQVLDVAVASGSELRLDVMSGNGDGSFGSRRMLDFAVPGYAPALQSTAVGLHACQNGPFQSLAIVLSGVAGSAITQPTIAVLKQEAVGNAGTTMEFVGPPPARVYTAPVEPIGQSLVANLDAGAVNGSPQVEMVVAIRGEPTLVALGLLQFGDEVFEPILDSIEAGTAIGSEVPVQIRSLAFATAFPATQPSGQANAVMIVHEVDVDGMRERRLSTRLVGRATSGEPILLPPDAGGSINFAIDGLVGGNFSSISVAGADSVRDLAIASRVAGEEITILQNDGFGGVPVFGRKLSFAGLVPSTMALVPTAGAIEPLVFLGDDSRLGYWRHEPEGAAVQQVDFVTPELRRLVPGSPMETATLGDASRIAVADFDGDGLLDLLVLLSFQLPGPGPEDSMLVLMRGRNALSNEFPFELPQATTRVHGNASSIAVGDFAGSTNTLEVALAVPRGSPANPADGNYVRFYRLERGVAPAEDRFVPSAVSSGRQVLLAGDEPTRLAAHDFDRDGLQDLLVASGGDSRLRLFRNNTAPAAGASLEVDVDAFEAPSSPNTLGAGEPTLLRLGDVNGDGNLDVVCWTEFTDLTGVRSTAIATYLSAGTGAFSEERFASSTRIGQFDARLSGDLGDWNRDGVPDLLLGWGFHIPTVSRVNLRVLFGGTR
ncbi:MAG: FG-GAP repeat domain-containing protein [Planctomycetota bacterium]